ncbi:hypothetical protein [Rugamonas apoptosis]|uniref:Uncharacterized protein n=1 Tax=Rugamonas apoptosis TaxID=2758570 RepID=A0A7W2F7X0_9BURK|nr:hypothetical protein [Rugamonas apoptosis]MBA5686721.1 hypothetical protein [Rugamonas apoptosis]
MKIFGGSSFVRSSGITSALPVAFQLAVTSLMALARMSLLMLLPQPPATFELLLLKPMENAGLGAPAAQTHMNHDDNVIPRRMDVSSHFNYGGNGFDRMKLARIEREANRNWLSRLLCRLFDCYREATD